MEKYTIYCTLEQTKKALELGAPIKYEHDCYGVPTSPITPTAEQMIGWLEEQECIKSIDVGKSSVWDASVSGHNDGDGYIFCDTCLYSRKEATLAAIDAALEYLSNNKK